MRDEVLTQLWRAAANGRAPLTSDEIGRDIGEPWFKVANVLYDLIREGLVREVEQLPNGAMTHEPVPQTTK